MATANPFDLLGDDDNDDPSQLIAARQVAAKKPQATTQAPAKPAAKLPTKPLPPAQAVKEAKYETRGGGRGGDRGYSHGRGGGGFGRGHTNEDSTGYSGFRRGQGTAIEFDTEKPSERRGTYGGPRGSFLGGRRGGFSNEAGDDGHNRRVFERRSGSGQGNEIKREGSGRGNWGTPTDEIAQITEETANEGEKTLGADKPTGEDVDVSKENPVNEVEEKEPENKEMTLEEFEKVIEENRKALEALKTEERKVDVDKDLASMQQLSNKKKNDDVFVKLGSGKDKRKEIAEKEEKSKKAISINEFLKPAEGERYSNPRGRGRGRGSRGGGYGGDGGGASAASYVAPPPKIEDTTQFPGLNRN